MQPKIFPSAASRLNEIWQYTVETWDEEQAEAYLSGLISAVENASLNRRSWKVVRHADLVGVWFIRYEHHFIFFRILPSGCLGVISILHESMDIPRRLKEDADT